MPGFYEPLVPQSAISPLQEVLERRRLDQSPLEAQFKGFGSGALEGLRSLSSPAQLLNIGALAVPALGATRLAPRILQGLRAASTGLPAEFGAGAMAGPIVKGASSFMGKNPMLEAQLTKYLSRMR